MADDADITQDRAEIEDRIRKKYTTHNQEVKATGWCLYCSEPLSKGLRFCDADCRDDWEQLQKR